MTTRRAKRGQGRPEKAAIVTEFLGHTFGRPELLTQALTHRSLSSETSPATLTDPAADNEQLEFLGDAVLGMVAAEALFRLFPGSREGELTRMRASIVSRKYLGEMAAKIDLGARLRLGRGEEASGGRGKPAILANAIEAVIAAIYLDGGLAPARSFVERYVIGPSLEMLHAALDPENTFSGAVGDHKSALQERLQASGQGQPVYVLTAQTGPDHRKSFRVEVRVAAPLADDPERTMRLAEAEGSTKKQAQQAAARIALVELSRMDEAKAPEPAETYA